MQIHELPNGSISDTDKIAFDTGANTYSGMFSAIASAVLDKLSSKAFSSLATTAKTVIGAINELTAALTGNALVERFTNLVFSALNTTNKTLPGAINELNTNLAAIGTIVYGTTAGQVSVITSADANVGSVNLTSAGKWLVIACGDWAANAAGYRQISIGSSGQNPNRNTTVTTMAATETGKYTFQQAMLIVSATQAQTVQIYARQNSGSSVTIYPYVYAVKIGN